MTPLVDTLAPIAPAVVLPPKTLDKPAGRAQPFLTLSSLTVIIPVARATAGLHTHVTDVRDQARALATDARVMVVADGPPGLLPASLAALAHVELHSTGQHRGKGAAVRLGTQRATTEWVAFIDGDGDIAPRQLRRLADAGHAGAGFAISDKSHPQAQVDRGLLRTALSRFWGHVVVTLTGLDVTDTQTGAKLFHRDVARAWCESAHEDGFVFDVELFIAARTVGVEPTSVPVELQRGARSSVTLWSATQMLRGLVRIARRERKLQRNAA